MRIRISVTERDIQLGKKCSCVACPIALAAGRALPGRLVEVFGDDLQIVRTDDLSTFGRTIEHMLHLPWKAKQFVYAFDEGKPVEPFDFTIDIPHQMETLA